MAEVRVGKNESLDTALKRFKRSCAKDALLLKFVKENITKSLQLNVRRSLRQLVSVNIDQY